MVFGIVVSPVVESGRGLGSAWSRKKKRPGAMPPGPFDLDDEAD